MGRVNASGAAEEMRLSDYCDGSDQSSLTLSKSIFPQFPKRKEGRVHDRAESGNSVDCPLSFS